MSIETTKARLEAAAGPAGGGHRVCQWTMHSEEVVLFEHAANDLGALLAVAEAVNALRDTFTRHLRRFVDASQGPDRCGECGESWPCEEARVLLALDELAALP